MSPCPRTHFRFRRIGQLLVAAMLPLPMRAGLGQSLELGSDIPSSLKGQVSIEHPQGEPSRLHVNARLRGSAPHGVASLPFEWRDGRIVLTNVTVLEPTAPGAEHSLDLLLDTTAQGSLLLSEGNAAACRAWMSAEIGLQRTCSVLGPAEFLSGALGGLRLGGVSMEPVPIRAVTGETMPRLGIDAIAAFEGMIIDWPRRRLLLVVRRTLYSADSPPSRAAIDTLAASAHWTSTPLRLGATADSIESLRHVFIISRGMWPRITIRVGDREYSALVSTGYAGDVWLSQGVQWPLVGGEALTSPPESAEPTPLQRRKLAAPLAIGDRSFHDVQVEMNWQPPVEMADVRVDAIIGVGLLSRAPVWLDFDAEVLRVWTGGETVAAFAGARPSE
ncbi:MAG: hypothetical protein IT430_12430 [Phycisphaerales bacterium]|nr:hypothetical protein [Phycisphaerales bacterium]